LVMAHADDRRGVRAISRDGVFNLNGLRAARAERFIYAHVKSDGIEALTAKWSGSRDGISFWSPGFASAPVHVKRRLG
jgi:hypothetical protein